MSDAPLEAPVSPTMSLTIALPHTVLLEARADAVVAESVAGSFCLLPRHVDTVAPLAAGILSFEDTDRDGLEVFVAVDGGLLVKNDLDVRVTTHRGAVSDDLATLRETVRKVYEALDDQERSTRASLTRLETSFVRAWMKVGDFRGG